MNFEAVHADDPRVIALLTEDDVDVEEYTAGGGDLWADCDCLFKPNGEVMDFVVLEDAENRYAVTYDLATTETLEGELTDADKAAFARFLAALEPNRQYDALGVPDGVFNAIDSRTFAYPFLQSCQRYAEVEGKYTIAFRGGAGYTYAVYEVG